MTCVNKEQERKARLSSLQELYYEVKRFWTSPLRRNYKTLAIPVVNKNKTRKVVCVKRFWTSPLPRNFQKIA
jgi:hypothetical protein